MNLLVHLARLLNIVPVPLIDTQSQLLRARAVIEATRLGVFDALDATPTGLTAAEVAERAALSASGAEVLLTALAAVGYLRERNGRYRNGPWVKRWLLDPQRGLRHFVLLQMSSWERLGHLGETLQTGRPAKDFYQDPAVTPLDRAAFTEAMRELSRLLLPDFVKHVRIPIGATRLLDIGGGHGDYGAALAARYPGLTPTVLDLEPQVRAAELMVQAAGNPHGVQFQVGDALTSDLGRDWDVILMVNLVHIFSADQNRDLFRRAREALSPGGVLVIVDQILGVSRARDSVAALVSLNMFSIGGRCYSRRDLEQLLREAGFARVTLKPFSLTVATSLLEARLS